MTRLYNPQTPHLQPMKNSTSRLLRASLAILAAFVFSDRLHAASGTWSSGASGTALWNTSGNWSLGTIPGGTGSTNNGDTATFNAGSNTITIDSGRNIRYITFDTSAGAFTIGSAGANGGNPLVFSTGSIIQIASTFTGSAVSETINAPLQFWGTSTITNASLDGSNTLNIAGGVTSGTSSAFTITLNGANTGANTVTGAISNGSSSAVNVTKANGGSWTLTGTNTYTGITTVSGGILKVTSDANLGTAPGSATAGNIVLNTTTPSSAILAAGSSFALNSNRGISLGSATASSGGAISVAPGMTLTYGGVIANGGTSNTLSKLGTGTLTLTGSNTYAGGTQLSGGTLKLDFSASGAPTNNILASGGALNMGCSIGSVGIASSDALSIVGNTTNTQSLGNLTFSIGASHINLAAGSGTLTLAAGTLGTRAAGVTLDISTTGSAFMTTTSTTTLLGSVALAPGVITVNGTDFATINGSSQIVAVSAGSYTSNTATTLGAQYALVDMTTANTSFTGSSSTLGDLRFNTAQDTTITMTGTAALTVGGGNPVPGQILVTSNMGSHTGRITGGVLMGISSRDLIISQNNTAGIFQIDSTITDNTTNVSGFTKSGAGKLVLTGTNAYLGSNIINEGTLVVAGDAVASQSQTLTTTSGSTTITGVDTTNLFIGERATGTGINATASGLYIAAMSGTGPGSTITLSQNAASTTTAAVTFLGGGALGVATGSSTTASSIQLANGATLQIGNGGTHGTLFAGQAISNYGTVALNRSDDFTFSNVITNNNPSNSMGAGALTKLGSDTATINVLNTYQGTTTISGGVLSVGSGSSAALSTASGTTTASSNVITGITTNGLVVGQSISGTGIPVGAVVTGINSGANTVTISMNATAGSNTYTFYAGSPLANGGVASAIGKSSSDAANLVLDSGTLKYTGASAASTDRLFTLTQNGGGLDASGASNAAVNFSNTGAMAFSGSGSRTLALSGSSTGDNTLAAAIGNGAGGSTSLTKSGAGKWVLSATNTYTGVTTISAGTLVLASTGSIAYSSAVDLGTSGILNVSAVSGGFSLASGQTLKGSGTVTGAITLASGSTLAIGNSPGTVTFDNNLTLSSGSISNFEINGLTAGLYDLAQGGAGSQTASFGGTLNLVFQSGFNTLGTVKIFDFETYANAFTTVNPSGLASGYTATFDNLTGVVSVVPEPATWALLAFSLTTVMVFRRRKSD